MNIVMQREAPREIKNMSRASYCKLFARRDCQGDCSVSCTPTLSPVNSAVGEFNTLVTID